MEAPPSSCCSTFQASFRRCGNSKSRAASSCSSKVPFPSYRSVEAASSTCCYSKNYEAASLSSSSCSKLGARLSLNSRPPHPLQSCRQGVLSGPLRKMRSPCSSLCLQPPNQARYAENFLCGVKLSSSLIAILVLKHSEKQKREKEEEEKTLSFKDFLYILVNPVATSTAPTLYTKCTSSHSHPGFSCRIGFFQSVLQSGVPQFNSLFRFTVQPADDVDPCLEFELTLLHRLWQIWWWQLGKNRRGRVQASVPLPQPLRFIRRAFLSRLLTYSSNFSDIDPVQACAPDYFSHRLSCQSCYSYCPCDVVLKESHEYVMKAVYW